MNHKTNHKPDESPPVWIWKFLTWTVAAISVLTILLYIFQPPPGEEEGLTLLSWVDAVFFPTVVVGLGFWLNDAARKRDKARDTENAENEIRKEFITHVMRAYNGAKKVRRVLKAHRTNGKIPYTVYEAQLEALMDAQLELELYKPGETDEETEVPNALLPVFEKSKREAISTCVSKLERYLNAINTEYERNLKLYDPSSQIPLCELVLLKNFIDDPFKKDFSEQIHWLVKEVKDEIEWAHSNGTE